MFLNPIPANINAGCSTQKISRNISNNEISRYNIDRVILEGIGPADSLGSGPYIDVRWLLLHSNLFVTTLNLFSQPLWKCDSGLWSPGEVELQSSQPWQPDGLLDPAARPQSPHCRPLHLHLGPQVRPFHLPFPTFCRFEGIHAKHSPDWQLALKNTRLTDSGALGLTGSGFQWVNKTCAGPYECQVSTSPHMAHVVHLRVRGDFPKTLERPSDPVTRLVGGPEMFVESSSMINLTCLVAWTAKPPDKVSSPPGELHLLRWFGSTMDQRSPTTDPGQASLSSLTSQR